MTTLQPSQILQEFKNFIRTSCSDFPGTSATYSSLHKGIIKMYFQARNVEIDYEKQVVTAEIPVTEKEYTTVSFECIDLERFLSSCIKNDKRSLNFYRSSLNYYSLSQVA
ncbi:hypothetical protein [Salinimicrobium flavum]|uniref:Uncharacterized protein n=1 Tax=Salinimicrobium flavum TaxID=1737065 RepID=A0ABW5IVI5_9FLAO